MRDVAVGDRLDRFELMDLVARGAMGSVFKAVDTTSGALVAIKVPYVQYESDVVFFERIRREEQIGREVDHPNVVRVLEVPERSRIYLAMELVEGRSLASLMRRGTLPLERALDIARQVCAGLAALHAKGIVHRDVKPENIRLTATGQVKILDFGIALLPSARRLTWAGLSAVLGTPDYMAPEQIRGRRGDARTDVYAVGTLLYEMLTGELPFDASNPVAMMHAKLGEEPAAPSRRAPGIPPSMDAIILRAIERDPARRHGNAAELLEELASPCEPRRLRGAARGGRNRARRPARLVSICVGVAAVLVGLGALL